MCTTHARWFSTRDVSPQGELGGVEEGCLEMDGECEVAEGSDGQVIGHAQGYGSARGHDVIHAGVR